MSEKKFSGLKSKLEEVCEWPHVYMFKFIIPADNHKLAMVESLFGVESELTTRQSSNNKFISITIKELMLSSSEVIAIYEKASSIEGIISL